MASSWILFVTPTVLAGIQVGSGRSGNCLRCLEPGQKFRKFNSEHFPFLKNLNQASGSRISIRSHTIAQLGVQYGHMGYYFITVAFMLVTVMLLSCCVPYYVVLLLDVMFVHVLHLSCLVCMYPNCFVAFPLYILIHGCPWFFIISNWTHKPHYWVLMQSSGQLWRCIIEVSN